MTTRVKVCGITREEDLDAAVDSGADAVGFISGFESSPRNLSIERAADLLARVPPLVTSVLVTTGTALAGGWGAVKRASPGAVQLYGDGVSAEEVRSSLGALVFRPYPVGRERTTKSGLEEAARGFDALLGDTYRKGLEGGTGVTSDWAECAAIRAAIAPTPFILSGGLRPENVELAVREVAPYCVDVSSGVESSPGRKDRARVRQFIVNAARADEAGGRR